MKSVFKLLFILGLTSGGVFAQPQIYWSPNPNADPGFSVSDMLRVDVRALFQKNADLSGGIKGTVQPNAGGQISLPNRIELRVYAYDAQDLADNDGDCKGCGHVIYEAHLHNTSTVFREDVLMPVTITVNQHGRTVNAQSNEMKILGQAAEVYHPQGCTTPVSRNWMATIGTVKPDCNQSDGTCSLQCGAHRPYLQPVIVQATVSKAEPAAFKIPGMGELPFSTLKFFGTELGLKVKRFLKPNLYPNYITLVSHRGYWRDVPENSLKAFDLAIQSGVPMVEIDIAVTKDSAIVVSHDKKLGQTSRTILPQRITQENVTPIDISQLTLCEIRPDLCNSDNDPSNDNACNCDPYQGGCNTFPCEPVKLGRPEAGGVTEPMPTLAEVLALCKDKVIVDVDKIDALCASDAPCTRGLAPYHLVYDEVRRAGSLGQVVVKGKRLQSPEKFLTQYPEVDWRKFYYTPTFFSETPASNQIIDQWVSHPEFRCVGFEWNFANANDPLYPYIPYIRSKGVHLFAFPSYPEHCYHVLEDPRVYNHFNWNYLLQSSHHRPTVIISDRLEALNDLLKQTGLTTNE